MKKERPIYAGDVVRIVNGSNPEGDAGYVGDRKMHGNNVLRVVQGVEICGNNEINVVVYRDEARKGVMYRYARKNIELVLTPSGKTKRQRAPRGEHWDVRPYPPERNFRVAPAIRPRPEPIPAPRVRPLGMEAILAEMDKPVKVAEKTDEEKKAKAKKHFHESILNGSGVSQWLYRTNAGWKQFVNTICHAPLRGDGAIHEHYEGITGVYEKLDADGKSEYRRWFDYLVNRSPWKDVYITKDIDEALVSHVEINVKLSSPIVMAGITILRTGHEYPASRRLFCHLVDHGVPEFAAMAATSFITKGNNGDYLHGGLNTNHTVFHAGMNPLNIMQFMLDGYSNKTKQMNVFGKTRTVPNHWSFGIHNSIVNNHSYEKKDLPWLKEVKIGFSTVYRVDIDKFKDVAIAMQEKANGK